MIFWNHGISKLSVVNFFFWISILIMLIQILLMSIIVPKSQELAKSKLKTSDIDYFESLIKPKKFNDTIKGLTIFAEDKNDNEEFKNIYIKKNNKKKDFKLHLLKKECLSLKGNIRVLVLYDGQTLTQNGENITNFNFSKSDFGLAEYGVTFLVTHKKTQEQSTESLIKCIQSFSGNNKYNIVNCSKNNPKNIYKELFKRLISPFLFTSFNINFSIANPNIKRKSQVQ
jgi:lipopolysaccharide export system permease protein